MAEEYDIIFDESRGFLGSNADVNIERLIASIINYAKHKKGIYEQNSPEKDLKIIQQSLRSSLSLLDEQSRNMEDVLMTDENSAKAIRQKIVDQNCEKYISTIENISKFRAKVAANDVLLQKYCIQYPKNPVAIRNELKKNITEAVNNLRREISGTSPQTVEYRRMVEEIVIKFASSWGAFKNSYALNYCLRGGAGVGKTTFAKAVAKCIAAYGILATDYVKLADKTDFIAPYIGQTVYKTSNTLYSSIEGVCFIDEAYALGQTHSYGAEFIDELTLFTQKFPGCICIIVAGYEKEMKKHFFDMNEGLYRRFPNNLELRPYDIATIAGAIVDKIASKLEITNKPSIITATKVHHELVAYLYMDTSPIGITYPFERSNLRPIFEAMKLSPSLEKRNIFKSYIFKTQLGIPEGDLLPNQMGDVQNIVDKILMTQSVIQTGAVTVQIAVDNINAFLAIRGTAKIYVDVPNTLYILTTNGTSPTMFKTNVIDPFILKAFGSPQTFESIKANPDAADINLNRLYTEAVTFLALYAKAVDEGHESIKVSSHVDMKFLNQEFLTLQALSKAAPDALLSYRGVPETISDQTDALSAMTLGTITIPKAKTIAESCSAGVPVVATRDVASNDGALPPSTPYPPNPGSRGAYLQNPGTFPRIGSDVAAPSGMAAAIDTYFEEAEASMTPEEILDMRRKTAARKRELQGLPPIEATRPKGTPGTTAKKPKPSPLPPINPRELAAAEAARDRPLPPTSTGTPPAWAAYMPAAINGVGPPTGAQPTGAAGMDLEPSGAAGMDLEPGMDELGEYAVNARTADQAARYAAIHGPLGAKPPIRYTAGYHKTYRANRKQLHKTYRAKR